MNGRGIRGLGRDSQTTPNKKDQEHGIKMLEIKKLTPKLKIPSMTFFLIAVDFIIH